MLEFDGRRLSQTGVNLTYLSDLTGKFGGRTEDERLEILRWLLFDNHKFSSFYSTLRLRVGFKMEGETAVTEFSERKLQRLSQSPSTISRAIVL